MYPVDDLFAAYTKGFEANREAEMTLPEYLEACRDNPLMYSTATERLLAAIGEPEMVDTAIVLSRVSEDGSPIFGRGWPEGRGDRRKDCLIYFGPRNNQR